MLGAERNFFEFGLDIAAVGLEESFVRVSRTLASECVCMSVRKGHR